MDILSYVRGVKTFKKRELVDQLTALGVIATDLTSNITRMEANKVDVSHEINQWAITKSIGRELDNVGYRGIGYQHAVKTSLQTVSSLVAGLSKMVQSHKDEVWSGKLLDLRQANLLNLIEHMDHWVKYTGMVYDVLLTLKNGGSKDPEKLLAKSDIRFINQTLEFYKGTMVQLLKGSTIILNGLNAIPEVEVSESSMAVMEATEAGEKSTLLKQGFGIHQINPVFWYQLNKMNLNLARIDKARRDNEIFAMKITQAVNQKNGVDDAQLDNQIEIYQDEIIKNVALIESIEAQYA